MASMSVGPAPVSSSIMTETIVGKEDVTNHSPPVEDPIERSHSRPFSSRSHRSVWRSTEQEAGNRDAATLSVDHESEPTATAMEGEEFVDNFMNASANYDVVEPQGCWYNFTKLIRSFWATRHTEDTNNNRKLYIKTTLRELIVYFFFLIVLMILTFGMTSNTVYYYTKVLNELFLDAQYPDTKTSFRTSNSISDFWRFVKNSLISGIYWDTWYNRANLTDNYIFYENKLLGVPRMRQLKVRSDSCSIAKDFRKEIRHCYAMYSRGVEDYRPFGPANTTAWNYSSESMTGHREYQGLVTTYSGGGYYVDLKRDKEGTLQLIDELFDNLWIERGTRVVFIDFTVYNANINLFCVIKLVLEFPATGGAVPSWEFRTLKLIRYVQPMDYFILVCEVIYLLFIGYYVVEEVIEIKKHRLSYFKSMWNWLDIIVIIISSICAVFNIYRTIEVTNKIKDLLAKEDNFPDFDYISYWQQNFNHAVAITLFLAWVKIFKYISFNKTMTQLSSTLGRCAKDLFGFAIMFFIVFFAFAQLGYLLFGTQVRDFREFQHSVFTLFRIILGDFDFNELENAHRVLGPIFFLLYVFFVFFVLINMFLAIINDTYSEVKSDLANQPNEFEMADYFKQQANKVMQRLNIKQANVCDIQKAIKVADINDDEQVDFHEWRAELKARGYADGEIEAVFAKYDLDGDRVLNQTEQKNMHSQFEAEKAKISEKIANRKTRPISAGTTISFIGEDFDAADHPKAEQIGMGVSVDEFTLLTRRVDRMEHSIGSIVSKIDAVLVKLEAMEKVKLQRRETMSRILDGLVVETDSLTDETKREQMERLVRDELERWNTYSPVCSGSGETDEAFGSSHFSSKRSNTNMGENNTSGYLR